jgi:hypothetical protein
MKGLNIGIVDEQLKQIVGFGCFGYADFHSRDTPFLFKFEQCIVFGDQCFEIEIGSEDFKIV